MRDNIARALWSDAQLQAEGVTRAGTYAGDVDTPEPRPYLVLRWGDTTPGIPRAPVRQRNLTIYVHDKPGDYSRIDRILKRIRDVFEAMYAQQTSTGWLTAIEWLTDSGDLSDDTSRTIMRTTIYNIVGSGM